MILNVTKDEAITLARLIENEEHHIVNADYDGDADYAAELERLREKIEKAYTEQ